MSQQARNTNSTAHTSKLRQFVKNLTMEPGVYQFFNTKQEIIYIGKARRLKNRVASYFNRQSVASKTQAMMPEVSHIEVIITNTENEALLLENNLIKQYQPTYNVFLRDDKSYPYLYLSNHSKFPLLELYRGKLKKNGRHFGPYPHVHAAQQTLHLLQKLFGIRSCKDSVFKNRTRPCLQYQIDRCSAPCVNFITQEQYQLNIENTILFLQGKSQSIVQQLEKRMQTASVQREFELAAKYRDQIKQLRKVQQQQIADKLEGDIDIFAIVEKQACFCIQLVVIRSGRIIGSKPYLPKVPRYLNVQEVLSAFLGQYYLQQYRPTIPKQIISNYPLLDKEWLKNFLSKEKGKRVYLSHRVRAERADWLKLAIHNAELALTQHLVSQTTWQHRWQALTKALSLSHLNDLECFDVSHTSGTATIAACVAFNPQGADKKNYRRFNIRHITSGDDYAALEQALTRHYERLLKHNLRLPEILLIDGGKGQVSVAKRVLATLDIKHIKVIGIAKGAKRQAGLETLILGPQERIPISSLDAMANHLLQQIRDEAHRFAITGHRHQRAQQARQSSLEQIDGIGPKRRQALLNYFGGLQALKGASITELSSVPGINIELAHRIYRALR